MASNNYARQVYGVWCKDPNYEVCRNRSDGKKCDGAIVRLSGKDILEGYPTLKFAEIVVVSPYCRDIEDGQLFVRTSAFFAGRTGIWDTCMACITMFHPGVLDGRVPSFGPPDPVRVEAAINTLKDALQESEE